MMPTKKIPTVAEHFQECDAVKKSIDNANALVSRLTKELKTARNTLEALKPAQHPMVSVRMHYIKEFEGRKENLWPTHDLIERQIELIDLALGDRK